MKFTAHPLPAPGRLLLEAKQFLRECFFFWRRLLCFHRILRASLTPLDAGGTGVPLGRFCFGESKKVVTLKSQRGKLGEEQVAVH